MDKEEMLKRATILKAAIRTEGIDLKTKVEGVGTTLKENVDGLYAIKGMKEQIDPVPNEIRLYSNITTKLVPNKNSPFELREENGHYFVFKKGQKVPLTEAHFIKRPDYYSKETSSGTPMKHVAQAMGSDCLAIAVARDCDLFKTKDYCGFCNISYTNKTSHIPKFLSLEDVKDVVLETKGKFKFYGLTGGAFQDRDQETLTYAKYGNVIKEILGKKFDGPFSFMPPNDLSLLEKVFETGVNVISFNREIWNQKAWEEICPAKAKIGTQHYDAAAEYAKDLWGPGNVSVQFLAGPWESNESLIEGSKYYADKGILPNITLFQASPGSKFSKMQSKSLSEIIDLFVELGEIYKGHPEFMGRKSTMASPSSNRSSISNEVLLGYLKKDNYNQREDLLNLIGVKQ